MSQTPFICPAIPVVPRFEYTIRWAERLEEEKYVVFSAFTNECGPYSHTTGICSIALLSSESNIELRMDCSG